jgi:hypothetical protein
MTVGNPATNVNLWMLGVRPVNGQMQVTVNVKNPDGTMAAGTPKVHAIPGYQVMVGALWAYLGGQVPPVTPESLQGFAKVWSASDAGVTVRAASLVTS